MAVVKEVPQRLETKAEVVSQPTKEIPPANQKEPTETKALSKPPSEESQGDKVAEIAAQSWEEQRSCETHNKIRNLGTCENCKL